LQVRPYDGQVLFEIGRQKLLLGRVEEALKHWQQIFLDQGSHQLQIVRLLAGQVPAAAFIETFQPDWRGLSYIWHWYHHAGSLDDQQNIVRYAGNFAERECPDYTSEHAARIWRTLARMQYAMNEYPQALTSLQRAFKAAPSDYSVRRQYGQALLRAEYYPRAESHLRWCFSRKPEDARLHAELVKATRGSLAHAPGNHR